MADIEIGASARARRVRFSQMPETDVEFIGDGVSRTERENLPEHVEPGVTYSEVRIAWHANASARITENEEPRKES